MRKYSFIILLGTVSLIGVCLVLLSTSKWGVILEDDSAYYLLMAHLFENYSFNNDLLEIFLSNLQPLFPFVLSWGHFIGIDLPEGARWFNSILFGLNIILIGIVTKKYTSSAWLGLSAALLMLSAPDILKIHLTAMSEPLFIFFMLIWLLLLLDYLKNSKLSALIFASIIVALAAMTRFAGIPVVATGLFGVLFLNKEKGFIHKFVHAVIFVSIPCLSLFLYGRYGYKENDAFQRHFVFHPVDFSYFRETASVFCGWALAPHFLTSVNEKVLLFTIGMVFCFIRLFLWHRINRIQVVDFKKTIFKNFFILGVTFICLYMVCLILAASFYDAAMLGSWSRYLIPIHVIGIIIFCGLVSNFFKESSSFKNDIGKIIIIYFFLLYTVLSTGCLRNQYFWGDKYSIDPHKSSYIIHKVKTMPKDTLIYSNNFIPLYIWADKLSFFMPFIKNPLSLEKNDKYLDQLSQMIEQLRKRKGILVYFNEGPWGERKYVESIKDLQNKIPLHLIAQDEYASIYDVQ